MAELDEFRAETRGVAGGKLPSGRPWPRADTQRQHQDQDSRPGHTALARPHDRKGLDGARLAPGNTAAAALDKEEFLILVEEMSRIRARPALSGFGAPT